MKKQNSYLETEFFNAVTGNMQNKVDELIQEHPTLLHAFDYNSFGGTPLTVCSFENHKDMISLLLSKGADPNRRSDWWSGGWNPVQVALNGGDKEAARFFIDHGALVGVHEAAGLSIIDELHSILTSNPSSISERGGDGCSALHFAGL